ncbi:MAG: hypothetical protein LBU65_09245 [Planctomycetaceae bacterium]|jgi:type II secretion system protein D|nr:hypothetical protein [Planctomycetaceae bacterium]
MRLRGFLFVYPMIKFTCDMIKLHYFTALVLLLALFDVEFLPAQNGSPPVSKAAAGATFVQKQYNIQNVPTGEAVRQLRVMLGPVLSPQTEIIADNSRPVIFVRGPVAAVNAADLLLPKIDNVQNGVTVGMLPQGVRPPIVPVSVSTEQRNGQHSNNTVRSAAHVEHPQVNPMSQVSGNSNAVSQSPNVTNAFSAHEQATQPELSVPRQQPPLTFAQPLIQPVTPLAPIANNAAPPFVPETANANQFNNNNNYNTTNSNPNLVDSVPPAQQIVPQVVQQNNTIQNVPNDNTVTPYIYRCRLQGLNVISQQIRDTFANRSDVHFVVRPESSSANTQQNTARLYVLAPPNIQRQISQMITDAGLAMPNNTIQNTRESDGTIRKIAVRPQNEIKTNLPSLPAIQSPLPFTPTNIKAEKLHATLKALFGKRLVQTAGNEYRFETLSEPKHSVTLRLTEAGIELGGDQALAEQMLVLFRQIDQPELPNGRQRRFISIGTTDPETVRQLLEANRQRRMIEPSLSPQSFPVIRGQQPQQTAQRTPQTTQSIVQQPAQHNQPPQIRPVNYTVQDDSGFVGGGMDAAPSVVTGGNGIEVPDFRFQMIPSLNVIVVDGEGAEVARLENMIREIERLTKDAESKIEILYLKNVNCISVRYVIEQIFGQIFSIKQGAVTMFPMVNPNAILLVGWGDAFDTMKDLLELLDQPVGEQNSVMRVIRLVNAPATTIVQTLRGAFPAVGVGGTGFAPRVNIIADQRTNAIVVQASPNDFREIERIVKELDVSTTEPRVRVQTFKLKNTLATDLASVLLDAITPGIQGSNGKLPMLELLTMDANGRKLIESGIMSDVRISRQVQTNTIIVSAPEHCMPLIAQLIEMLDIPNATAYVKVFQVKNGDATSMIETLCALIPTQIEGQVGPMLPGTREEDSLVPIRFAIDKRTNSILVACALGDWDMIEALLISLDRPEDQARKVSVYQVKSTRADVIATAINEYLRSKQAIVTQTPGAISPYEQIEQVVVIVPEAISNSLIVSATPKYYDEVMTVIADLDRQQPQVMIQVLIAEVTLGKTHEWGAEFGLQDSLLFDRNTFSNVSSLTKKTTTTNGGVTTVVEEPVITSGTANPGWLFNEDPTSSLTNGITQNSLNTAATVGSQLLTNFATARTSAEAGFGGMIFSANSDAVSVMIRLLQETSRLEVLSTPKIMALNNQAAFIHVGQEVPRINNISATTTGTNSSTTLDKVGLMLMVQPRITADDRIIMQVAAIKSSIGPANEGVPIAFQGTQVIRSPIINVIQTNTMIGAGDNETVMLSGLITKDVQKLNRKVPLLGDIPLVGKLFQYDLEKSRRTELLVILTPRIVRSKEDAERIKQIETARMSWCLPNVTSIYGDINVYDIISESPYTGDVQVIQPGVPEGTLVPYNNTQGTKAPRLAPPMPQPNKQPIPVPTLK